MKKDDLKQAAIQAKMDISDEIDSFIDKIDKATDDPDNFLTMTQLENEWHSLSLSTHKTYSDMVSNVLSSIDTKEVNQSKKDNSSRKE